MPVTKSFEHTVPFRRVPTTGGGHVSLPLVTATLIQPRGNRFTLPLLFDTGASVTTLRHDLYPLLGVPSWDSGQPVNTATAGSAQTVTVYQYRARIEVFGKAIDCAVNLAILPPNPLFLGLFGRESVFKEFGFGFWESTEELFATGSP